VHVSSSPSSNGRSVVHLACSRGGHLDVLLRHQEAFEGRRIVWVTQRSERSEHMRRDGAEVHVLGEWHGLRGLRGESLRPLWRSLGLVLRHRPRVVVTSGTGIVVPFCLMARLAGARLVFVETAARVRGGSRSGRVLSHAAHRVVAQWSDMRTVYPHATIARASVVEGLAAEPATDGVGTFVVVGTHSQPFDRLLRMVDRAAAAGVLPAPVSAQSGPSRQRMEHAVTRDFVSSQELETAIGRARYVVCHAGTGSIATALRAGRRPLVLGRLEREGEHFDDHQQQIVDKLAAMGLVVPLGDEISAADLERADQPLRMPVELERLPLLVDCLRDGVRASS
jgi:UDP-N-acetylglucosamine--N-acetylmuramyl-(pentapeptide) pyrophosphoryl-undecaprenol N-acetylglucosamine transferase